MRSACARASRARQGGAAAGCGCGACPRCARPLGPACSSRAAVCIRHTQAAFTGRPGLTCAPLLQMHQGRAAGRFVDRRCCEQARHLTLPAVRRPPLRPRLCNSPTRSGRVACCWTTRTSAPRTACLVRARLCAQALHVLACSPQTAAPVAPEQDCQNDRACCCRSAAGAQRASRACAALDGRATASAVRQPAALPAQRGRALCRVCGGAPRGRD